MENFFLRLGFKKIDYDSKFNVNIYFMNQQGYTSYGVFDNSIVLRKLSDDHTWRLSISEYEEYHTGDELDLIEFCNEEVFYRFISSLLIEFKNKK